MTQLSLYSGYLLEDDMTVHRSSKNSRKSGACSIEVVYTFKSTSSDEIEQYTVELKDADVPILRDDENLRSNGEESDHSLNDY